MEEAPSRLPSHHPYPEAFLRFFTPPADARFYAGPVTMEAPPAQNRHRTDGGDETRPA